MTVNGNPIREVEGSAQPVHVDPGAEALMTVNGNPIREVAGLAQLIHGDPAAEALMTVNGSPIREVVGLAQPMHGDPAVETLMAVNDSPIREAEDSAQPTRRDLDPEREAAETLKVVKGNNEMSHSAQLIRGGKDLGRKAASLANGSDQMEAPAVAGRLEITTRGLPCPEALGTGPVYGSPTKVEWGAPPPSPARGSLAYKDTGRIQSFGGSPTTRAVRTDSIRGNTQSTRTTNLTGSREGQIIGINRLLLEEKNHDPC